MAGRMFSYLGLVAFPRPERAGADRSTHNHGMVESACLALPDVLPARARNRLRGISLGQQLPADGTIPTPHMGSAFCSTRRLQRGRARHADRSLRRILPAAEAL